MGDMVTQSTGTLAHFFNKDVCDSFKVFLRDCCFMVFVALASIFVYLPVQVHLFYLPVVDLHVYDQQTSGVWLQWLSAMFKVGQVVILKSIHSCFLIILILYTACE